MTAQNKKAITRRLAVAKLLADVCRQTVDEIDNPPKSIVDEPGDEYYDPVSDEYRAFLCKLLGRLDYEIEALATFCESFPAYKTHWPTFPSELVKERANASNWHGLHVDLMTHTLRPTLGMIAVLQRSITEGVRFSGETIGQVRIGISEGIALATSHIDAAIEEYGGDSAA